MLSNNVPRRIMTTMIYGAFFSYFLIITFCGRFVTKIELQHKGLAKSPGSRCTILEHDNGYHACNTFF